MYAEGASPPLCIGTGNRIANFTAGLGCSAAGNELAKGAIPPLCTGAGNVLANFTAGLGCLGYENSWLRGLVHHLKVAGDVDRKFTGFICCRN